jgi:hypothetical protein
MSPIEGVLDCLTAVVLRARTAPCGATAATARRGRDRDSMASDEGGEERVQEAASFEGRDAAEA